MSIFRIILITASAAALAATPAIAHPGRDHARGRSQHGCTPHKVGYVASGTLRAQTLALDAPGYSGDVTIDVARANRHARADKGRTVTYMLDHARVVLGLDDQNGDGRVDLGDVAVGSRAKVIGKVTKLGKKCDQTGFTPQLTITKLVVHEPKAAA